MSKLTAARLRGDITLLQDFRIYLEQFQSCRARLRELGENVERNWMMGMDINAAQNLRNSLTNQMMAERREIAKHLTEVKDITDRYPLRTELLITPPRLLGGQMSRLNLFEAFIQLQLPHDFVMDPIPVYDVVDQAIWACERQLKELGPEKVDEIPQNKMHSPPPQEQGASPEGGCGLLTAFTLLTGAATLVGLIALCPKPSIDRDITLDEKNPFEMQFRVHNSSPWFDLYGVKPTCELLKVEIGSVTLPKGSLVQPNILPARVQAGGGTPFPCHLSPQFKADSPEGYKSADVTLRVDYKWFGRFGGDVTQRIILTHDSLGRPVWLFTGNKE